MLSTSLAAEGATSTTVSGTFASVSISSSPSIGSSASSVASTSSSSTNRPLFDENADVGGICLLSPTTMLANPRPNAPTACDVRTWDASSKITKSNAMEPIGTRVATESGLMRKHGITFAKDSPYFWINVRIGVFSPRTGFNSRNKSWGSPMSLPFGRRIFFLRLLMSPGMRCFMRSRRSLSAFSKFVIRRSCCCPSNLSISPASILSSSDASKTPRWSRMFKLSGGTDPFRMSSLTRSRRHSRNRLTHATTATHLWSSRNRPLSPLSKIHFCKSAPHASISDRPARHLAKLALSQLRIFPNSIQLIEAWRRVASERASTDSTDERPSINSSTPSFFRNCAISDTCATWLFNSSTPVADIRLHPAGIGSFNSVPILEITASDWITKSRSIFNWGSIFLNSPTTTSAPKAANSALRFFPRLKIFDFSTATIKTRSCSKSVRRIMPGWNVALNGARRVATSWALSITPAPSLTQAGPPTPWAKASDLGKRPAAANSPTVVARLKSRGSLTSNKADHGSGSEVSPSRLTTIARRTSESCVRSMLVKSAESTNAQRLLCSGPATSQIRGKSNETSRNIVQYVWYCARKSRGTLTDSPSPISARPSRLNQSDNSAALSECKASRYLSSTSCSRPTR